jgi:phenylacetic acid degradation operon negative regulatory protein
MAEANDIPDLAAALPHQHLIVTVYGLYSRPRGGPFAVAELIALLSALGVEAAGVRSAVSRLKKRGILVSIKRGNSAAYGLAPDLEDVFTAGDERIFASRRASKDDHWMLASYSVPESQRHLRHKLRSILTKAGCGQVSPGLWIAPGNLADEVGLQLERAGLMDYVDLFRATHLTEQHLRQKVGQWWDLSALEASYDEFLGRHEPLLAQWTHEDATDVSPAAVRQAFADYVPMVTQWRKMPYLDPGLPEEYLPNNWRGLAAQQVFTRLHRMLEPGAYRYVQSVIRAR